MAITLGRRPGCCFKNSFGVQCGQSNRLAYWSAVGELSPVGQSGKSISNLMELKEQKQFIKNEKQNETFMRRPDYQHSEKTWNIEIY